MQLGVIGLGRMGFNMIRRLIKDGRRFAVFDQLSKLVKHHAKGKAVGAATLAGFQDKLLPAMRFGFGGHLEKSAK